MGDICVFSAGPSFRGDANDLYMENFQVVTWLGKFTIQNGMIRITTMRTPVTGPLSYTYEKRLTTGFDNGVPQTKQEEVQVNIEGAWTS